jgi:hypothetical protein
MNNKNYKFLSIIFPLFSLVFFIWLAEKRTDGFITDFITRFECYDKNYEIQVSSDAREIKTILSQKYHYLTRGKQSFIFESNDKKYILKFFDNSRFFSKFYILSLPLPNFLDHIRKNCYNKRKSKLEFDLSSVKIAYERLKDDAVLVHANLTKTNFFNDKLCVTNKYGRELLLDLNNAFFILQKKCELFYPKYEESKDEVYKNHLLESFLEMIHRRTLKLVVDNDIGKNKTNWGVFDNKAVTIDIGRWYIDENLLTSQGYKKHMVKATVTLRKYLLENDPQKIDFLDQKLKKSFEDFDKCLKNKELVK